MKILVFEHASGGGFSNEPIPAGVLSEGFGMLSTLISDFKTAGHNIITTIDSRLAKLNPPLSADCVVPVRSVQETKSSISRLSEEVDGGYVIAPETNGILHSLVEIIEQSGAESLNCSASAIEKVSNKANYYKIMRTMGVPIAETSLFRATDDINEIIKAVRDRWEFPVIFKPVDAVSCCGISVVKSEDQVATAVAKIMKESANENFLVQELIEGDAASVSMFSTGNCVMPVSLNYQHVRLKTAEACSSYTGGSVPFNHLLRNEVFKMATKSVESVQGLRGYVGMDFILTDKAAVAIEINPRLTTSYVGLRRVVNFNPAQAIINAVLKGELPAQSNICGYTRFSKIEVPSPTISALHKTYRMEDVVSPPFPISNNELTSALIASHGETLVEARASLRDAKKHVISTISKGR